MTKQEKIKEAYKDYYFENSIDENGWTDSVSQGFLNSIPCDYKSEEREHKRISHLYRPVALNGIENNNGWIKIESEADLPKDSFNYYLYCNDGRLLDMKEYDYYKKYLVPELKATHYQPIEKPKPPIY